MNTMNSHQTINSMRKSMLRKGRKKPFRLTLLVGLLVAALAYFALAQSGLSDELSPVCGLQEHIHAEACFIAPELICGLEESEGYAHDDNCYDEDMELICDNEEVPGHKHGDDCRFTEQELICDKTEADGYEHGDDCFRPKLICGFEEHNHSPACYSAVADDSDDSQQAPADHDTTYNDNTADFTVYPGDADNLQHIGGIGDDNGNSEQAQSPSDDEEGDEDEEDSNDEEAPDSGDAETIEDPEAPQSHTPGIDVPYGFGNTAGEFDAPQRSGVSAEGEEGGENDDETDDGDDGDETEDGEDGVDENDENDEDDEDDEDGDDEDDEDDEEMLSLLNDFSLYSLENYDPTAIVASVTLPIAKVVEGDGAREAMEAMEATGVFPFEAIRIADASATTGVAAASAEIRWADFAGGLSAETTITIPVYSYGDSFYIIREVDNTTGDDWVYSTKEYKIRVNVNSVTGEVRVYNIGTGEQIIIRPASTLSTHSRRPDPYIYTAPLGGFIVEDKTVFEVFPHGFVERFLLEHIDDPDIVIYALCADYALRFPAYDYEYTVLIESRDNTKSALAFALFDADSRYGADLTDDEFNAMFGFAPGEITGNLRRGIVQYAIWYLEEANPVIRGRLFNEFSIGTGLLYDDHFFEILRVLDEMITEYASAAPGESIAQLKLEFVPGLSADSGTIVVGYEGYEPPVSNMELIWTGTATVQVNSGAPNNSGAVAVKPGDSIAVTGIDGAVTFTLIDHVYHVAGGSIRGGLLEPEAVGNKGWVQNIFVGCAEFVKMSATVSIGGDKLDFLNLYTTNELPETYGLGAEKYFITGAVFMLFSVATLFTQGVRPARQIVSGGGKRRLISLKGKRTRKLWGKGKRK